MLHRTGGLAGSEQLTFPHTCSLRSGCWRQRKLYSTRGWTLISWGSIWVSERILKNRMSPSFTHSARSGVPAGAVQLPTQRWVVPGGSTWSASMGTAATWLLPRSMTSTALSDSAPGLVRSTVTVTAPRADAVQGDAAGPARRKSFACENV